MRIALSVITGLLLAYTALISNDTRSQLPTLAPSSKAFDDYIITETLDARHYDTSWFSITSVYRGGAADDVRGIFAGTNVKDLEDTYRKNYVDLFDDIRQQGHINYSEDSEKNIVTACKRYAIPQLWATEKTGKRSFGFQSHMLEQNLPDPAGAPDNKPRVQPSASPNPGPASFSLRDWKLCWPAIWLTFFFSLLFSCFFHYLDKSSQETRYAPGSGYPLGGWIALLGISLGSIILSELAGLLMAGYYSNTPYIEYGNAGGRTMQYIVLSQLGIHLSFIAGAASLLYCCLPSAIPCSTPSSG